MVRFDGSIPHVTGFLADQQLASMASAKVGNESCEVCKKTVFAGAVVTCMTDQCKAVMCKACYIYGVHGHRFHRVSFLPVVSVMEAQLEENE